MKKFLSAVLLGSALLLAAPAQAQMFRQAMADNVYEQNIPNFRQMGLMGPTGMGVNLDVVAQVAYEMATRDGSLATLPEDFRREDNYKTRWRTVNGLTNRTMPLDQFRSLVNGQGIRLLRASDFETVAPAPTPIATAPAVAPAPVASPAPVRSASPADQARIRGLESRIAAAEAMASQGRVSPAQLAELSSLRSELNRARASIGQNTTDITNLTTAVGGHETRLAAVEKNGEQLNAAIANKADKEDVGISVGGWVAIIAALIFSIISIGIGLAVYGRTIRLNKRVTAVETRVEEIGDALPSDIRLTPEWQQIIDGLAEDEEAGIEILVRGDSGFYEPKFTVNIKRGTGDNIFCLAGIKGHNPKNALAAKNLERSVRKAGFNNLLDNPVVGLRVAA